ncbi:MULTISPECIES: hypothetical protein [unclassified Yoonia]|uniref:hypothetical protein n=1 Tax=unclassified Yoonia TaxID=2629118 RepID=UPI002AFF84CD|nr:MULTISPECIES: hypothetical protein [unclassified Yoonia]
MSEEKIPRKPNIPWPSIYCTLSRAVPLRPVGGCYRDMRLRREALQFRHFGGMSLVVILQFLWILCGLKVDKNIIFATLLVLAMR